MCNDWTIQKLYKITYTVINRMHVIFLEMFFLAALASFFHFSMLLS